MNRNSFRKFTQELILPLLNLIKSILALPRGIKRLLAMFIDSLLCIGTVLLAFSLRLDIRLIFDALFLQIAAISVALALPIFVISGLYRTIYRHIGWYVMIKITKAVSVYGVMFASFCSIVGFEDLPRGIEVMQPLFLLIAVGGVRALARYWLNGLFQEIIQDSSWPVLMIYGAGQAGRQLAQAISSTQGYRFVGFIDDDSNLHGQSINSWQVMSPNDFASLIETEGVSEVLLAIPSASRSQRNECIAWLSQFPVLVRTLPSMVDLVSGRVSLKDLRDLDIEDLLGRDPVPPDEILVNRNTRNKTVMVTGAGGSIGSELCRQILACEPKRLLLVDNSEVALYSIHQFLLRLSSSQSLSSLAEKGKSNRVDILPLLGSVLDEARMLEIISTWCPDTVYHAAAYKHVPLVEHNPTEGIRNNVWGTWICAKVALACKVDNFVLISTDKAVRPTNIMGASKRLAEMVLQAISGFESEKQEPMQISNQKTCFSIVRFGNVLGSSGSVVPLFREQIKRGGPITLTHPDITRFFMTIPEAAQLVVQAGAMAKGGDVFVLDMGQPVRIYNLAQRMIELSGFTVKDQTHPYGEIEIIVTGLRPGEKLYEELLIGNEAQHTQHLRIMKANEKYLPHEVLMEKLISLDLALSDYDTPLIRRLLEEIVSDYSPISEVVDFVHLAKQREKN